MPIATPTVLDTVISTTSNTTIVSNSIAPAANALLVVIASTGSSGGTFTPITISDNLSGGTLTWTRQQQVLGTTLQSWAIAIFTAQTGASPGTGTITITFNANGVRDVMHVIQVASGFNTSAPVAQSKSNSGNASTLTVTLDATPATDSLVIGGIASRIDADENIAAGTNFTELADTVVSSGSTSSTQQVQYDQDNAAAAVDWSGLGTTNNVGVAIEIAPAAAGGDQAARTVEIGGQFGVMMLPTGGAGMVVIN